MFCRLGNSRVSDSCKSLHAEIISIIKKSCDDHCTGHCKCLKTCSRDFMFGETWCSNTNVFHVQTDPLFSTPTGLEKMI